jgi:hypothetical protein
MNTFNPHPTPYIFTDIMVNKATMKENKNACRIGLHNVNWPNMSVSLLTLSNTCPPTAQKWKKNIRDRTLQ